MAFKRVWFNYLIEKIFLLMIVLLLWSVFYSTVQSESIPPNGNLFWLITLLVTAFIGGEICCMMKAPPLVGMLIAGFGLRNTTNYVVDSRVSASLRSVALTVILLRAGFGLDPKVLKKLSGVCLRLAFTPCLVETLSTGLTGHLLLGLPWKWAILLGFVLSAVSPAVVVPQMIILNEKKLGTNKGIPTLVIAASSVDDVLAITGFGVLLGMVFASGTSSLLWQILQGPVETMLGIALGAIIGSFLWIVHQREPNEEVQKRVSSNEPVTEEPSHYNQIRFVLSLLFGLSSVFVSQELKFSSVGPLATLTLAFVAGLKWRLTGYDSMVESSLKTVWMFCQPFLFGLIGAEVDLATIQTDSLLNCLLALLIGLLFRCVASMFVIWGAGLTLKERLFVALSWLPKATVQAAIGPVALDMARKSAIEEYIENGTLILNFAVISIIVTAPLGALLISLTSERLLSSEVPRALSPSSVSSPEQNDNEMILVNNHQEPN